MYGAVSSENGKVFLVGLSSRLLIFAVAAIAALFSSSAKTMSSISIVNYFSQWDGGWYSQIALQVIQLEITLLAETGLSFPYTPF